MSAPTNPLVTAANTTGVRIPTTTGRGGHVYVPYSTAVIQAVLFVGLVFLAGIFAPEIWTWLVAHYATTTR